MAIFPKNDVIFAMTSQTVQILCVISQVGYAKKIVLSFKLNIRPKMLRFRKVTLENLKIEKVSVP